MQRGGREQSEGERDPMLRREGRGVGKGGREEEREGGREEGRE